MFMSRLRLRRAAVRLAAAGWPVTPGACLRANRFDCGRPGCPTVACHPAMESWEQAASCDPARVAGWWHYAPYSVLLPTGTAINVLEVPAPLGALVVGSRQWVGPARGPVAASPTGRTMFLTLPTRSLLPQLATRLDVLWHTRGSWVPAPPTRLIEGPVRWTVSPSEVGWQLPDSGAVQALLADALSQLLPRARTGTSATEVVSAANLGFR
jgi:hypothetical protein